MAAKKQDEERPLHEQFPPVTFTPMGAEDKQKDQGNLLSVKQAPGFLESGGLIAHALSKRAERIMLDYAQTGVGVKYEVDGLWMNIDPRDRQTGDAMLAVYKKISNLNPSDRRSRQEGKFGIENRGGKYVSSRNTTSAVPSAAPPQTS